MATGAEAITDAKADVRLLVEAEPGWPIRPIVRCSLRPEARSATAPFGGVNGNNLDL